MGLWDFHSQNLTFNPGLLSATVSGNVIVNTVAGVPAATFQPINKRLASPVIPGTLTVSRSCHWLCPWTHWVACFISIALASHVVRNCAYCKCHMHLGVLYQTSLSYQNIRTH